MRLYANKIKVKRTRSKVKNNVKYKKANLVVIIT